ncbi:MAG: hypothetical protein ACE5IR_12210 [bacterium]
MVCRDSTLRSALDNCPRVGLFLVPFTESSVEELASIDAQVRAVLQQHGVERIRLAFPNFNPADTLKVTPDGRTIKYNVANVFVLRLAQANDRRALIKKLTELPGVVYAEPNIKIVNRGSLLPTDPSFLLQWNMENSNDTDSDTIAAWGIHTGSANDIIGIVDDGNVMTPSNPHSEFSGRVIYGDATPVIKLDGTGLSHAALVAGILNVAATTKLDEKADYSLPKPFVDVAAPGGDGSPDDEENILSATFTVLQFPNVEAVNPK